MIKAITGQFITEKARQEVERKVPMNFMIYGFMKKILQTSGPEDLIGLYFQKLNESMANCRNPIYECYYTVVKSTKESRGLCVDKWVHMLPLPEFSKFFTGEPNEEWMELTSFKVHVKPLWFAGNRVYQFPTQLLRTGRWCQQEEVKFELAFNCKMSDDDLKLIMTADFSYTEKWLTSSDGPTREKYSRTRLLLWQIGNCKTLFESAFTELRLCYYANSEQPRVWIRCPLVTQRDFPAVTTIDLAPIYSGETDLTLDAFFDVKKLEAPLMALMNQ